MISLHDVFCDASILEVGANRGDISEQLLTFKPACLTVTELSKGFCEVLKKRFKGNNVLVVNNDILDDSCLNDLATYNVVILKEMLGALPFETYDILFKNCIHLLKKNGKLVIVDYVPKVLYRQFFLSLITNPMGIRVNLRRLIDNINVKKHLTNKQIRLFFPEERFQVNYQGRSDVLNAYDSFLHRVLERIIPCKYVAIIESVN